MADSKPYRIVLENQICPGLSIISDSGSEFGKLKNFQLTVNDIVTK